MNKHFKILSLFFCIVFAISLSISCMRNLDNSNNKQVDFSKARYLAFGDSVTFGNYLEKSYPKLVAEELGCKSYNNKGFGGATYVYRSERVCIANTIVNTLSKVGYYDIISVNGGVNDHDLSVPLGCIDDITNETIYGSLNIIAEALKERQSNCFVFLMTPKPYVRDRINNSGYKLIDVADAVIAVGQKYNIPVLDLFRTSQFDTADIGMNHPDCDGSHPTQEFINKYLVPQIVQFIKANYKK